MNVKVYIQIKYKIIIIKIDLFIFLNVITLISSQGLLNEKKKKKNYLEISDNLNIKGLKLNLYWHRRQMLYSTISIFWSWYASWVRIVSWMSICGIYVIMTTLILRLIFFRWIYRSSIDSVFIEYFKGNNGSLYFWKLTMIWCSFGQAVLIECEKTLSHKCVMPR